MPPQQELLFDRKIEFHTALPHAFTPPNLDVVDRSNDELLRVYQSGPCQSYYDESIQPMKALGKQWLKPPIISDFLGKITKQLQIIFPDWNMDEGYSAQDASNIGDILLGEERYRQNYTFKDSKEDFEKIRLLNSFKQVGKFTNHHMMKTIFGSHIFLQIRSELQQKVDSLQLTPKKIDPLKLIYFSTHDTTITPLAILLGQLNRQCILEQMKQLQNLGCGLKPNFGAILSWEL